MKAEEMKQLLFQIAEEEERLRKKSNPYDVVIQFAEEMMENAGEKNVKIYEEIINLLTEKKEGENC